jgi:hypothetical protein
VHKTLATILLLLAVGSTGCNRNRVSASSMEGQIGHAIEERCPKTSDCLIRLRDVTSFNWDKMFYFDYAVSPAEREKAVGVQLETLPAHELFHDVPGSIKAVPFDSSVLEMEFILASGPLPRAECGEMQSSRSCGVALSRAQAA